MARQTECSFPQNQDKVDSLMDRRGLIRLGPERGPGPLTGRSYVIAAALFGYDLTKGEISHTADFGGLLTKK